MTPTRDGGQPIDEEDEEEEETWKRLQRSVVICSSLQVTRTAEVLYQVLLPGETTETFDRGEGLPHSLTLLEKDEQEAPLPSRAGSDPVSNTVDKSRRRLSPRGTVYQDCIQAWG